MAPAKADLKAWQIFLTQFNGTQIISHLHWSDHPDFEVTSDSSVTGFAAVFQNEWLQGRFPDNWLAKSIAIKEFVPIYLAFKIWGSVFANSYVVFHTDNESVMFCLQTHTSRDATIMRMLREMVLQAMHTNVVFTALHLPGKDNVMADALSRFQFTKARAVAPNLAQTPVEVPASCYPWQTK